MQLHAGAAAATSEAGVPFSHATCTHALHPSSESSSSSSSSNTPVHSSSSPRENTLTVGQSGSSMRGNTRAGQQRPGGRLVTDSSAGLQAVENNYKDYQEEQLTPRGLPGRYQDVKDSSSRTSYDNTNDLETDGDGPVRPAGARALPGISRVLFDNAVKENAKLKKMLHEALQKEGSNMKVFLVSWRQLLYCVFFSFTKLDWQNAQQFRITNSNIPIFNQQMYV